MYNKHVFAWLCVRVCLCDRSARTTYNRAECQVISRLPFTLITTVYICVTSMLFNICIEYETCTEISLTFRFMSISVYPVYEVCVQNVIGGMFLSRIDDRYANILPTIDGLFHRHLSIEPLSSIRCKNVPSMTSCTRTSQILHIDINRTICKPRLEFWRQHKKMFTAGQSPVPEGTIHIVP